MFKAFCLEKTEVYRLFIYMLLIAKQLYNGVVP